jgi:hypothetical protein
MPDMPLPDEPEKETADAELLFRDPPGTPSPSAPPPPPPAGPQAAADDAYDIVGPDPAPAGDEEAAPIVPPVPPRATRARATTPPPRVASTSAASDVEPWSRWAEWGPDVIRLAGVAAGVLLLLYLALSAHLFGLGFFLFVAGAGTLAVFGYPLFITFERPVRITPEQALKDFYAALSHLVPHYRRMWLLLSTTGRRSTFFSTVEGFRGYWHERIAALLGAQANPRFNPLAFEVQEFRSEKSAGQTEIEGSYTLAVFYRDRRDEGPVATYHGKVSLVRGPDRMWYLNQGLLPPEKSPSRPPDPNA